MNNSSGGCLLAINSYFILPTVSFFTIMWFLFGGLSGNKSKYLSILIGCILYILISLILAFKYVYKVALKNNEKDKKVFVIIILILFLIGFISFLVHYF